MSETRKDKVTDDDARLRGHAVQDHDRVKAELENHPDGHSTHHAADQILKDRDEALDEVRAVRDANEVRTRRHSTVEHSGEIAARSPAGNEDVKPVSVVTADGRLYINSHGEKVLDRDGIVDLQRHLAAAFQAVS